MTSAAYTPPPFPCSIVVVKTTGQLGKTFKFEKKDWCVLGANEDCDIIVPFPGVAQLQALIHVKCSGVFLQGIDKQLPVRHPRLQRQLLNEEEVLLLPGDCFFLGERKFLIEYSPEKATIESACSNNPNVLDPNESRTASRNPRTATLRSSRALKKRRKSSLVVGEFDEKYVSPRTGSEKLLSKTQLARISNSEFDIRPPNESHRNRDDQESSSRRATLEDDLQSAEDLSSSSSSDESSVIPDLQDRVSRSIDFSAVEDGLAIRQLNGKQPDAAQTSLLRKVSSRERRDIVFARLSKGLSATPRRGEKSAVVSRNDAIAEKVPRYSPIEEAHIPTGKENVPQLCAEFPKAFKPTARTQGVEVNRIRSPLSNRAEMENQTMLGSNQGKTTAHKTRLCDASTGKPSIQTPGGRSVAFASNIELAAGAHYSPFRQRPVANRPKSTSKSKTKSQSGKPVGSARTRKVQGRLLVGSTQRKQKQIHSTKTPDHGPIPTSSSGRVESFSDSKDALRDASHCSIQPVLEYEEDSDPPTPSSTDEGPESSIPQVPGPSPMARVGGALAAFLSRLSGTLDSDEDNDSSPETEESTSFKALSFTESQEKSHTQSFHRTEPVMSASEVKGLSRAIPPGRRKAFVTQVESAAADARQAMQPVPDDLDKALCSSRETLEVDEMTRDVLAKAEDGSIDPVIVAKQLAEACGSDSKDQVTCQEEFSGEQKPISTGFGYAADSEQTTSAESDPSASEIPILVTEETASYPGTEEVGDRSTSLEEYKYPSVGDSEDLEIEQTFPANNFNQKDLRHEESEGDEIDYGDECDEASMESSDREIAAVVIDGDEEDISDFPACNDGQLHEDNRSPKDDHSHANDREAQSPELEDPGELQDTAEETKIPQSMIQVSSDGSSELREREGTSVSIVDGTRIVAESSIASDGPARTRIRTDIEEVTEIVILDQADDVEGDVSKSNQDAIPSETFMLEDMSTQISTVRKELSRLKKDELKAKLVALGLDASGLKKDLVERLAIHIAEETNPGRKDKSTEHSSTPIRQKIMKGHPAIPATSASPRALETPRAPVAPPSSGETDSTAQQTHSMVRRSGRKKRAQSPVIIDLESMSPTNTSQLKLVPQIEVEAEAGPHLSSYRKRTVKELRQFLKNQGLDIQQKMRKEELIQHLISLSIGSDGSLIEKESESPAVVEESKLQRSEAEPPLSAALKSYQRMTVTQLRTQLKSRGQCQTGTKKTLLERLSSLPERRTRSGRTVDGKSCPSCQTGKVCEGNGTK